MSDYYTDALQQVMLGQQDTALETEELQTGHALGQEALENATAAAAAVRTAINDFERSLGFAKTALSHAVMAGEQAVRMELGLAELEDRSDGIISKLAAIGIMAVTATGHATTATASLATAEDKTKVVGEASVAIRAKGDAAESASLTAAQHYAQGLPDDTELPQKALQHSQQVRAYTNGDEGGDPERLAQELREDMTDKVERTKAYGRDNTFDTQITAAQAWAERLRDKLRECVVVAGELEVAVKSLKERFKERASKQDIVLADLTGTERSLAKMQTALQNGQDANKTLVAEARAVDELASDALQYIQRFGGSR